MNRAFVIACFAAVATSVAVVSGCPPTKSEVADKPLNISDITNGGAVHVGTSACKSCHTETWAKFIRHGHARARIGCESCHGPGGSHFSTQHGTVVIDLSRIFVDPDGSQTCANCHSQTPATGDTMILADGGYVLAMQQWSELKASGGHSNFVCTYCHDPHWSVEADRPNAIRNECIACHPGQTGAGHVGNVLHRGDYTETVTCESCHMTFAARAEASVPDSELAPHGRQGDARTHIFRIDTRPVDFTAMFSADGSQVVLDAQGRAAVTVDFVCLRCHNDQGVPLFDPGTEIDRAAEIAPHIHDLP